MVQVTKINHNLLQFCNWDSEGGCGGVNVGCNPTENPSKSVITLETAPLETQKQS